MADPKLTSEEKATMIERYVAGETGMALAKAYEVAPSTINRHLTRAGVIRAKSKRSKQSQAVVDFAKRVRSVLWRQDKNHATYQKWRDRAEELESPNHGGYTRHEAVVRASKEFPCLRKLFREYDVSFYDPNPESHPDVPHGNPITNANVLSEGIEGSHRDNLRWAIDAAGRSLRTGEAPKSAPNDAAYYLFRQAIEEPKDFLSRVNQIEAKGDEDERARMSARKQGERSVAEIEEMLKSLNEESSDEVP